MPRRPERRWIAVILCILLGAPATTSFPAEAGSVLSHSVADFSKGTLNNTALWPEGLILNGAPTYNWTNIGNCSPCTQWAPVIDYDAARGNFIMVGRNYWGYDSNQFTWTYNLSTDTWVKLADTNKPRQIGPGAFNAATGEMIIQTFNGTETWAMDIATGNWSMKGPASHPSTREGFSTALDTVSGEIILFGGVLYPSMIYYNETWSYNLSTNTWTNRTPALSPAARVYASMVYDCTNKVMVLFGGNAGHIIDTNQAEFGDTWVYDSSNNTWTNKTPAISPPSRDKFGMAYHKAKGETILYGGYADKQTVMGNDTWSYNLSKNTWTNQTPKNSPPPRAGHSLAYDPVNDKIVLVGGVSPSIYNWRADSWSYNSTANNWTMGTLQAPSLRWSPQMAYDSDLGEIVLFGGMDQAIYYDSTVGTISQSCGDTWKFNLTRNQWTLLSPTKACQQIKPLFGHGWYAPTAMAYDRRCREMVVFNPEYSTSPETYAFNLSTNTWKNMNPDISPNSRGEGAITMTYHEQLGVMVLYQSTASGGLIHTYNLSSNNWSYINSFNKPDYTYACSAYLKSDNEILFFGLIGTDTGETWKYNLSADQWTKLLGANDPSARNEFSMAYDRSRDEVVLFGGIHSGGMTGYKNDTWCFNAATNTWNEKYPINKPPAIYQHTLVYNEIENEFLMVGGLTPNIWTFNRKIFCETGYYTSLANDTGGNAFYGNITWSSSIPENTSLLVQIRSSANESLLNNSNFTGPDGTAGTYYNASGQRISDAHNGDRWIQYRVFMNTTYKSHSPSLTGIQIHYNLMQTVNITSPIAGNKYTGTQPIKWSTEDKDTDSKNFTYDLYLLDENNDVCITLIANYSSIQKRYDGWDTTKNHSGDYRIKIVARDLNEPIPLTASCTTGVFKLAHPNNLPVVEDLISPAYGEVVNSSQAILKWSASDIDKDPLEFHVFYSMDEFDIGFLPETSATTNETSITITNLTDKAMYFWSVIANDTKDNSTMPAVSMFTVDIPIIRKNRPPEVTLVAPQDGATVTTMSTQLSWTGSDADGDRLSYIVFFAEADFNLSGLPALFTRTNDTFLDTGNLTDGATYYWAVIANDGRDNSTVLKVWKFTVHIFIPPDTPRVIEYSPNGTKVPRSPAIIVGFDRAMNYLSVVSALAITPAVDIINCSPSGSKYYFYLGSPLALETRYNVTVSTGVKSSIGKNMFLPFNWSFTTLGLGDVDSVKPTILVTDPLDGAQNVDKWKNVTVYFSEAMAQTPTTAACSITPHVNGTWHWKDGRGYAIRFVPTASFNNWTYKITVSRAATDESGNPLTDNVTFSFTVGVPMTGKPRLLTKSLAGEGVRTNAPLVLAFDRQMDPASVISAFRISPLIDGNWTYDDEGKVFTFTPSKTFRAGTTYSVAIGASAKDMDGNPLASEVSWTFKTVEASGPVGIGMGEWLQLALVIIVVAGIAAFAVTRRKKTAGPAGAAGLAAPKGFAIEDIFLMYNDGRLIQHSTRRIKADMDVDIFTSMLTALQAFVKDSMGRGTGSELGSMEFGGDKILFEKGKYVIIAVVITGGEPAGFRDEMKSAVKNVESEYGAVLKDWDGGASQLSGAKRFLAGLGAYKAAEEALDDKIKVDVSLKSEVEFYQGFVRLKVAIKNTMASVITHATFKLVYDKDTLRLDHIEPGLPEERGEVEIGIVGPGEKKTIAFYLDPQICTESYLEGVLTFKDAHGSLETVKMPRKLTSVVCPILFTDENINTAMLKRMAADQLDRKDSKVFTIPSNMTSEKAFEVGKAAVQHHDVRLVREFREDRPFRAEAWYYGKAKGRPDKLVVQVRVIPEMSFLEFSVSSDSVLMLTGMLAELKSDLNKELESHKLKGAMKQVVDKDDMEAVAEIRLLLEKATETEPESVAGKTEKES